MPNVVSGNLKGSINSLAKHGDINSRKDTTYMSIGHSVAGEQFYRLTEHGAYRIVEDSLALRILEETP